MNASWGEVDLIGCLSVRGQSLLDQVTSLEDGQLLSLTEIMGVANTLMNSVDQLMTRPLVGGDVRAAGRMLRQLSLQLSSQLAGGVVEVDERVELVVETIGSSASSLLDPDLSPAWMGMSERVGFDASDFLESLETYSRLAGITITTSSTLSNLTYDHLHIRAESLQSHDSTLRSHDPFLFSFKDSTSTVALKTSSDTPSSLVTFGLFPTLAELLPLRGSFNTSHMTLATPILSIQVVNAEGSEFTNMSVNLTLDYTRPVLRPSEVGGVAICVSWLYGEE